MDAEKCKTTQRLGSSGRPVVRLHESRAPPGHGSCISPSLRSAGRTSDGGEGGLGGGTGQGRPAMPGRYQPFAQTPVALGLNSAYSLTSTANQGLMSQVCMYVLTVRRAAQGTVPGTDNWHRAIFRASDSATLASAQCATLTSIVTHSSRLEEPLIGWGLAEGFSSHRKNSLRGPHHSLEIARSAQFSDPISTLPNRTTYEFRILRRETRNVYLGAGCVVRGADLGGRWCRYHGKKSGGPAGRLAVETATLSSPG